MQIDKQECEVCKALHPDTLFPSDDGVCVYCKAEEAERLEPPEPKLTKAEAKKKTGPKKVKWSTTASGKKRKK